MEVGRSLAPGVPSASSAEARVWKSIVAFRVPTSMNRDTNPSRRNHMATPALIKQLHGCGWRGWG